MLIMMNSSWLLTVVKYSQVLSFTRSRRRSCTTAVAQIFSSFRYRLRKTTVEYVAWQVLDYILDMPADIRLIGWQ